MDGFSFFGLNTEVRFDFGSCRTKSIWNQEMCNLFCSLHSFHLSILPMYELSVSLTDTHAHKHTDTQTSCGHVVTNPRDEKRFHADRMSLLSGRRLTRGSIKERLNQLLSTASVTAFLQGGYMKGNMCSADLMAKKDNPIWDSRRKVSVFIPEFLLKPHSYESFRKTYICLYSCSVYMQLQLSPLCTLLLALFITLAAVTQ